MASGAAKDKTLEQERFFGTGMTFSQSLMVTHGTLNIRYG